MIKYFKLCHNKNIFAIHSFIWDLNLINDSMKGLVCMFEE